MDFPPKWKTLKILGQSKFLKWTYFWFIFVPLAAKIFPQIDFSFLEKQLGIPHPTTIQLPFSWHLFYFSSCFFTIGGVLFSISCPPFIANFRTFMDFYKDGGCSYPLVSLIARYLESVGFESISGKTTIELLKSITKTSSWNSRNLESNIPEFPKEPNQNNLKIWSLEVLDSIGKSKREELGNHFELVTDIYNGTRPVLRGVIMACYAFGSILMTIVAVQSFITIFQRFWKECI